MPVCSTKPSRVFVGSGFLSSESSASDLASSSEEASSGAPNGFAEVGFATTGFFTDVLNSSVPPPPLPKTDFETVAPNAPKGLCELDFVPKAPNGEAGVPDSELNPRLAEELVPNRGFEPAAATANGDWAAVFANPLLARI